jgi:hypothetical protein
VNVKVPFVSHFNVKVLVVPSAFCVVPIPATMGASWDRSIIRGKIVTRARDEVPWGDVESVMAKCEVPLAETVATASWWRSVKEGVVAACAAVGHAIVARQRSTTLSARHQVENRWNMLSQST